MSEPIADAVRLLTRCGQWDVALSLLAAVPDDPDRRRARAGVLIDHDFWSGACEAHLALAQLADDDSWDACSLRARHRYTELLRIRLGGELPDAESLGAQWQQLLTDAPDDGRAALARLYLGLTAEVLEDRPDVAAPLFRAVAAGPDEYLAAFALRHLGGQADDRGDRETARDLWNRSLRMRQRTGHLTGVLAQLQLLADDLTAEDIVAIWAGEIAAHVLVQPDMSIQAEDSDSERTNCRAER